MIAINKEPSFTEVWREGYVEYKGEKHRFWIIHPQGTDSEGREYEIEVRWFFQRLPKEVRAMYPLIINAFKQNIENDTRTKQN